MAARAPRPRPAACSAGLVCVLALLLWPHSVTHGADDVIRIDRGDGPGNVVIYLTPLNFTDAVRTCASTPYLNSTGALVPIWEVASTFLWLSVFNPDLAAEAIVAVTTVVAGLPEEQDGFDMWSWDPYRSCRASSYIFGDNAFFVSSDRPCHWTFCFACMEARVARSLGWPLSSEWLPRVEAAAQQPSTYAAGLSPDLRLVRSGLAIGAADPPATGVAFYNGTAQFLSSGPIVTFMARFSNFIFALAPVHQADAVPSRVWTYLRYKPNSTPVPGAVGEDSEVVDGPKQYPASVLWEGYNIGQAWNDYIVRVEGCMRSYTVEKLVLVTRTGRRLQLGRGTCTQPFAEDAPQPGGYLAAFEAYHSNLTTRPAADLWNDSVMLHQLRPVWAAPGGAGDPVTDLTPLPVVAPLPAPGGNAWALPATSCGTPARAVLATRPDTVLECGNITTLTCPSNRCCGDTLSARGQRLIVCGSGLNACKVSCREGFGLCGDVPEQSVVQFTLSPSSEHSLAGSGAGAGRAVFLVNSEGTLNYQQALAYCSDNTHLGLSWSLITPMDAMSFHASHEIRLRAMTTIYNKQLWVKVARDTVDAAPSGGCLRVLYGPFAYYTPSFQFGPTSCLTTSTVVCRALADQNTTTVGVPAGTQLSTLFQAGMHNLTVSRRLGTSRVGTSCPFATAYSIPDDTLGSNSSNGASSRRRRAQETHTAISSGISSVSISMGHIVYDEDPSGTETVQQVSAIRIASGQPAVPEAVAGMVSSGGWSTLTLQPGEVVTAVSGCYGTFIELLVLHTSFGRRWSPPLSHAAACSVPFLEQPPQPGGYLAGLQGVAGSHLEQLQLVWGTPEDVPLPPPPQPAPAPPPLPPLPFVPVAAADDGDDDSLSGGAVAGIVVGAVVGTALLAALLLLLLARRRRRREGGAYEGSTGSAKDEEGGALYKGAKPAPSGGSSSALAAQESPTAGCDGSKPGVLSGGSVGKVRPGGPEEVVAVVLSESSGSWPSRAEQQQQQQQQQASLQGSSPAAASPALSPPTSTARRVQGVAVAGGAGSSAFPTDSSAPPSLGGIHASQASALAGPAPVDPAQYESDLPELQLFGAAGWAQQGTIAIDHDGTPPSSSGVCGSNPSQAGQASGGRLNSAPRNAASTSNMHSTGQLQQRAVDGVVLVPDQGAGSGDLSDPLLNLVLGRDVDVDHDSYLGHGASGIVRRGVLHNGDGTSIPVAVKLLNAPDGTETNAGVHGALIKTLAQEVHVLSRLDHPNVVRFYGGSALQHRSLFLVEELMDTSLAKLIHGKRKDTGELHYAYGLVDVLMICRDVAMGLAYLHPTVVHRDLKPGNVLLNLRGTAKIGDFGLARFKAGTALSTQEVEVGTAPYMAPEIFMADGAKVTDRADVYSLGTIMWELAMRKKPWDGVRNVVIGFQVAMEKQRPPLPPPDHPLCPPPLRSLIERCWRHNPDERPSSGEVAKKLTVMLAELAAPSSSGEPGAIGAGSSSAGAAAAAAALAARAEGNSQGTGGGTASDLSTAPAPAPSGDGGGGSGGAADVAAADLAP